MIGTLLCGLGLCISGAACAFLGKRVRYEHWNPLWSYVSGAGSLSCWAWLAKYSPMSLANASIIFDVVYGLAYFAALQVMGEPFTKLQALGIVLCGMGTILVGL